MCGVVVMCWCGGAVVVAVCCLLLMRVAFFVVHDENRKIDRLLVVPRTMIQLAVS